MSNLLGALDPPLVDFFRDMGISCVVGDQPMNMLKAPKETKKNKAPERERPCETTVTPPSGLDSVKTLEELKAALENFEGSSLKSSALNLVFGDGNPKASLLVMGEAPGADEDRQGLPFVGVSGQLLDRMLAAIGQTRQNTYITNVVPWRPPGNRTPTPSEIALFRPFALKHIELIAPQYVLAVGSVATKALLDRNDPILKIHGKWQSLQIAGKEVMLLPTLHPAFLLRNQAMKKEAWSDLLVLKAALAD